MLYVSSFDFEILHVSDWLNAEFFWYCMHITRAWVSLKTLKLSLNYGSQLNIILLIKKQKKIENKFISISSGVRTGGGGWGSTLPPFGDGTGNEDLSFYFNDPLLLRTELAEIANMSLLFNSPV